jgi:two-component system chemotaxis response regulator CheB
MPGRARAAVAIDYALPAAEIGGVLERLALDARLRGARPMPPPVRPPDAGDILAWPATGLTCPDCGGALYELPITGGVDALVCHTGHRYSAESLGDAQGEAVERAAFAAIRALREQVALTRRILARLDPAAHGRTHDRLRARIAAAEGHAEAIRRTLLRSPAPDPAQGLKERDGDVREGRQ